MRIAIRNDIALLVLPGLGLLGLVAAGTQQALPTSLAVLRLLLGLFFVLLAPGYLLQSALFPRADELDGPERLALAFGLSIAVIPPIVFVLDRLPWGIRLWPIVTAETLVVSALGLAAWIRRRALPQAERFRLEVAIEPREWWGAQDQLNRLLLAVLATALLVVALSAAAIIALPKPAGHLTEFYLVGVGGLAEDYPEEAVSGQPLTVTVGVVNHEGIPASYHLEAIRDGLSLWQAGPLRLEPGQSEERSAVFVLDGSGEHTVAFLLYRDGLAVPYRSLRLTLDVSAP